MLASVGRVWPAIGVILVGAALVGGSLGAPAAAAKVAPVGASHPTARQVAADPTLTILTMHGQVITYKYVVINLGNVTLRNVTAADTRYGPITCPRTTLVPGASMTCRTAHAITAVDLDEGSIFNSSMAVGRPPVGGPAESAPAHATVTGMLAKPELPELPEVPVTG